jgi:hypothetical protein
MHDREASGAGSGVQTIVHTSVATFYSNLVTRPTGRAVRVAIEQQIQDSAGTCLSILDFSHVGVVDFSCADEVIAKLLLKYIRGDRPSEAFFILKGVAEHHKEPIETVLRRHNLLLVTLAPDRPQLWGPAPSRLRRAWEHLGELGRTASADFATSRGLSSTTANAWLKRLVNWRLAVEEDVEYLSLPAILAGDAGYESGAGSAGSARAAEEPAAYDVKTYPPAGDGDALPAI